MMKLLVYVGIILSIILPSCSSLSYQYDLIQSLFTNYSELAVPTNPNETVVTVSVRMYIESIVDVNDEKGTINIASFISMGWTDSSLCWDPIAYNNITNIVVPSDKIWKPDVAFQTAYEDRFFKTLNVPANIGYDCSISFTPAGLSTHSCNFDTTKFPFDVQTCEFQVITWFSDVSTIVLVNRTLGYADAESNNLWRIIETSSSLTSNDAFMTVTFTLKLKRKSLYSILYGILPLLMMAILNLLVFRLPCESGEKISLSITVMLAFAILLITLKDATPASSDTTPIMTCCAACFMVISTLGVVVTAHVIRVSEYKKSRPVPPWLFKVLCVPKRVETNGAGESQRCSPHEHERLKKHGSWHRIAAGIDRIAFYTVLVIEVLVIVISGICFAVL